MSGRGGGAPVQVAALAAGDYQIVEVVNLFLRAYSMVPTLSGASPGSARRTRAGSARQRGNFRATRRRRWYVRIRRGPFSRPTSAAAISPMKARLPAPVKTIRSPRHRRCPAEEGGISPARSCSMSGKLVPELRLLGDLGRGEQGRCAVQSKRRLCRQVMFFIIGSAPIFR